MTKKSDLPKEKPKPLALRRNMNRLKLSNINKATWGPPSYGIGGEVYENTEAGGHESDKGFDFSVFNYTNEKAPVIIDEKLPGSGISKLAEPVSPFIRKVSTDPNCADEGSSSNASGIFNAKGIEEHVELQWEQEDENRINFDRLKL